MSTITEPVREPQTINLLRPLFASAEQALQRHLQQQGLRVDSKIGRGMQGDVYLLKDKTNSVAAVLKITDPPDTFHPNLGPHLIANIKHPNICSPSQFFYVTKNDTFSLTPEEGAYCIGSIMPYVEGNVLKKVGPTIAQKAESLFHFGFLLTDAVKTLADRQIEHGDLDSRNIMVNHNLEPVIIDFDLCTNNKELADLRRVDHRTYLHRELSNLIFESPDINRGWKIFLEKCIEKGKVVANQPATSAKLMRSFMQACLDHLDEIKKNPDHIRRQILDLIADEIKNNSHSKHHPISKL